MSTRAPLTLVPWLKLKVHATTLFRFYRELTLMHLLREETPQFQSRYRKYRVEFIYPPAGFH